MRIVALYGAGLRGRWRQLRRRPADRVLCGLWWHHRGECVPFVPGDYLRAPFMHPLDLWMATSPFRWPGIWRCPDGCPTTCIDTDGPTHDMAFEASGWALHDIVMLWRFSPCDHTFRDVIQAGDKTA